MASTTPRTSDRAEVETVGGMVPPVESAPPEEWFDRASITIDAMVIIEGVSEEDWWRYAPEKRVCEFFDGVVYMPSPASPEHQDRVGFLFDMLNGFRLERGGLIVRLGPGVLRLAQGRYPEPDIFVMPAGPEPHEPPALLVVEVLSKSTRTHDLVRKAEKYREAGIPEVVYVDDKKTHLLILRRRDGGYVTETVEHGLWHSVALPGFWIDVAWLWADPLPNPRRCLEQILAGPPA